MAVPIVGNKHVELDNLWAQPEEKLKQYWDDVSGKTLSAELVQAARAEEIKEATAMGVWVKVPRAEAFTVTGRPPVGTRWVDTNKGDEKMPKVRSRIVAQELRRESDFNLFVATPPIEFVKYIVSRVASGQDKKEKSCLMVQDIGKAFFHAPATRAIYVELPSEALDPEDKDVCGKLEKSLYGTRDAALNWSLQYTRVLLNMGFQKGSSSPCTFFHPGESICLTVHGDDFISEGTLGSLQWMDLELSTLHLLQLYLLLTHGVLYP